MIEPRKRIRILFTACALGSLALLSGCRVGPPYHAPAPPAVTAPNYKESTVNFHDADGWKVASPQDAMIRGNWWEVFNDPELNALEEQLNINNENLKEYFQNYMAARAVIAEARSQYWPTITANPSWSRSKSSGTLNNSTQANVGKQSTLWNAPIDVSWTPDFWGKIRNEVHEAEYASQVSAADLQTEKLTEQASLAQYFFEIRGQDMLQQILNQTVADEKKSLDYTQAQYDTGVGDYISVAEAKTTVESAEAAATNVGLLRAQYEHAIAVLLGKAPSDFSIPVKPMLYKPPSIPTGVPSQLAERRPDIAAAERTMKQENALIGVAIAGYYPDITLSAMLGFAGDPLSKAFTAADRVWSLGASASETVFQGGYQAATVAAARAGYDNAVATYRQTVLSAFQQVEDDLSDLRILQDQAQAEDALVAASQRSVDVTLNEYQAGTVAYTSVITQQELLLSAQQTALTVRQNRLVDSVALIQALGGGWDAQELPAGK